MTQMDYNLPSMDHVIKSISLGAFLLRNIAPDKEIVFILMMLHRMSENVAHEL